MDKTNNKEEVSAEAFVKKYLEKEYEKGLGYKVQSIPFIHYKMLARMLEEYANTVISSQPKEEAPLYKQFYDRIHAAVNEFQWTQINKQALAEYVVRTFDSFAEQINAQESKWIPVEQDTEYDGDYLCVIEKQEVCGAICKYQRVVKNRKNKWVFNEGERITHWQPLPTLPTI
jgi:hypothetical protein